MIQLGQKVRCKVTGFTGTATSWVEYLNGCIQFHVRPEMDPKVGKYPEGAYIDQELLEVIGQGILPKKKKRRNRT